MKRPIAVLSAALLVLILAVSLAVRVSARTTAGAPGANVPAPRPIDLGQLDEPFCWGCSWNQDAPLEFQVDLDLLAPLGDGKANGARWFSQFAGGGPRFETYKSRKIEVRIDGQPWNVLSGDDPLLREAEPWIDQARLSFYPEVWDVEGMETRLPHLLMMLDLARSWTARGKLADDPESAREDFRRAIRLGRLLRQDDVTVIQDLVAIACIRIGAEAMYEQARDEGDAATMVVTSLVMADKDAMRLYTARRITTAERAFGPTVTDADLEAIVEQTRTISERRLRMEGMIALYAVKHRGTEAQRDTAQSVLDELADGEDELTARLAGRFRDTTLDADELAEFLEDMVHPRR